MTTVTAVVLAWGSEPWLERSVEAVLASTGVTADVVLVDNGCADDGVARLEARDGVTVVRPGRNLGFAGGCNAGAAVASGDVLALVNGDAVVAPGALAALAGVASKPDVGIATASIRLADRPDHLNTAGNDIHFLGFSWSGHFGESASAHQHERDAFGASGATCALRRELWAALGGFDEAYFAYHEDAELSLRCWQQGFRNVFVPDAEAVHRYEFSRNQLKLYLVERNRLLFVLTLWQRRTLVLLAPVLLAVELATLLMAVGGGWGPQKVAGWGWIIRHRRWLRARRARLQQERVVSDRELAPRFATRLDPANYPLPNWLRPLDLLLARYWSVVRRFL